MSAKPTTPRHFFKDEKIAWVPPNLLKQAADNPRIRLQLADLDRFKALRGSLDFGWFDIVFVEDETFEIVDGHQRLDAAIESRMPVVPVVFYRRLTQEEKVRIRISKNRHHGYDSLPMLREQIATLQKEEIPMLGLDQVTLSNLDLTPLGDTGPDAAASGEEDRFATLKVKMTREDFDFVDQWIKRVCKRDRCRPGAVIARVFTEWSQDVNNQIEDL